MKEVRLRRTLQKDLTGFRCEKAMSSRKKSRYTRKGTGDAPLEVSLSRCDLFLPTSTGGRQVASHATTILETRDVKERLMGREQDPRQFEKGREVREEQTRNISEEASEEDRRQWEKTRDIGKEVSEIPEEAQERPRQAREDRER